MENRKIFLAGVGRELTKCCSVYKCQCKVIKKVIFMMAEIWNSLCKPCSFLHDLFLTSHYRLCLKHKYNSELGINLPEWVKMQYSSLCVWLTVLPGGAHLNKSREERHSHIFLHLCVAAKCCHHGTRKASTFKVRKDRILAALKTSFLVTFWAEGTEWERTLRNHGRPVKP